MNDSDESTSGVVPRSSTRSLYSHCGTSDSSSLATLEDRSQSADSDTTDPQCSSESEYNVLPDYESVCPIDPTQPESSESTDLSRSKLPGGISIKENTAPEEDEKELQISTQKEDDVRGRWFILSTLGEGAYGDVKLVEDIHKQRLLALKIVPHPVEPVPPVGEKKDVLDLVKREILIHKNLVHSNIIRFAATRTTLSHTYIFLEYACGGELYDRIEPDFGVPRDKCHKWFLQIMAGMEYCHDRGLVHRDIKPENLLLNENDDIKISDFGLATLFRDRGKLRLIYTRRGTPSYVAPEVYVRNGFHGPPLDIWSAGVVLVAMVSGELPWEVASVEHEQFAAWKAGSRITSPWNKLPAECLALLIKMLDAVPENRATLAVVKANHWYMRGFTERAIVAPAPKRFRYTNLYALSQPQNVSAPMMPTCTPSDAANLSAHSLTQPDRLDDLYLSQSQHRSQAVGVLLGQSPLARLVKRMTRFFLSCGVKEAVETLKVILEPMHMNISRTSPGSYTVSGRDRNKGVLMLKVSFVQIGPKLLIDFRLSRGDGLEFKRIFAILRQKLYSLIDDDPAPWTAAPQSDAHENQLYSSAGFGPSM